MSNKYVTAEIDFTEDIFNFFNAKTNQNKIILFLSKHEVKINFLLTDLVMKSISNDENYSSYHKKIQQSNNFNLFWFWKNLVSCQKNSRTPIVFI